MLLIFGCRLASDHEDRYARRIAQRMQRMAKFETGKPRHHQIEKNGRGLVLERQPEGFLGVFRFQDFIAVVERIL